jgi:hypothetical protein
MRIPALVALALVVVGSGCSTIMRPTRPDHPPTAQGDALPGVRFDGEETVLREPGMPLSPSRSWQREVANYTATSLNTILSTPEDAPPARTIVSFDLGSPSVIQIGTWKEMTITLTSTLPDGSVIKSQPVTGNIDDPIEYTIITGMGVGGTVLDVTAGVATLLFFFTGGRDPNLGLIAIGALLGGLTLNLGQSAGQYLVAASEEKRWSNLYAQAIEKHAADVRKGIGTGPPKKPTPPPTTTTPPEPTDKAPPTTTTPDPSDPPPPLLEPK